MFDIAWSELLIIGAVALIVIGPKDLPKALRTLGEMVGKIRRMATDFQGQFNDAMREAEIHDIKKTVEGLGDEVKTATSTTFNPIQSIRDEIKTATEGKATEGKTTVATPGDAKAAAINAEAEALMKADAAINALPLPEIAPVSLPTPEPAKPATKRAASKVAAAAPVVEPLAEIPAVVKRAPVKAAQAKAVAAKPAAKAVAKTVATKVTAPMKAPAKTKAAAKPAATKVAAAKTRTATKSRA
jgi:sec-independent protein translocase protein TatB